MKRRNEMGFFNSLINLAGAIVSEMAELEQNNLEAEMEQKELEELKKGQEYSINVRNIVKLHVDKVDEMLKKAKETYISEDSEEIYELIQDIAFYAEAAGNKELLKTYWEIDDEELEEQMQEWQEVIDITERIFDHEAEQDGYQMYKSHLGNDSHKFAFQMGNVLEDLLSEEEDELFLLKKTIDYLEKYREQLKINLRNWNQFVEIGYDELSEI